MVGTKTNLLSVPTLASPHSPTTRVTPPASHGHSGFPEKTSSPHTFALEIGTRDANQIFIRRRRTLRRFHGSTRRASIVAMGQRRYRVPFQVYIQTSRIREPDWSTRSRSHSPIRLPTMGSGNPQLGTFSSMRQ